MNIEIELLSLAVWRGFTFDVLLVKYKCLGRSLFGIDVCFDEYDDYIAIDIFFNRFYLYNNEKW